MRHHDRRVLSVAAVVRAVDVELLYAARKGASPRVAGARQDDQGLAAGLSPEVGTSLPSAVGCFLICHELQVCVYVRLSVCTAVLMRPLAGAALAAAPGNGAAHRAVLVAGGGAAADGDRGGRVARSDTAVVRREGRDSAKSAALSTYTFDVKCTNMSCDAM